MLERRLDSILKEEERDRPLVLPPPETYRSVSWCDSGAKFFIDIFFLIFCKIFFRYSSIENYTLNCALSDMYIWIRLVDCFAFYAVSAIFQPCNGSIWMRYEMDVTGLPRRTPQTTLWWRTRECLPRRSPWLRGAHFWSWLSGWPTTCTPTPSLWRPSSRHSGPFVPPSSCWIC